MRWVFVFLCICTFAEAHEPDEEGEHGLRAPLLLERVDAVYPVAARKAGVGGVVGLELEVGADGKVTSVKVARPAGFGFDEAAVAAAHRFRFRPATRDGKPIASVVLFDQQFVIRPHLSAAVMAEPEPASAAEPPAASSRAGAEPPAPPQPYEAVVTAHESTASASATTINNRDLDIRPRTSPGDLLREVPGLLTAQHQGGGKADQLFLRGFDADHGTDVAVYLDGIPLNLPSHAHGQGYTDTHFLIPELIASLEVSKGSYDVRFGDFATAGAINLVTRDALPKSQVSYTMSMLPTVDGRAVAGGRFLAALSPELPGAASKLHPLLAFDAAYDKGPFVQSENLQRWSLFGKLTYDVTPQLAIGVGAVAFGTGWVGSGQIPLREVQAGRLSRWGAIDPTEGGQTQRELFWAFLRYKTRENEVDANLWVNRYSLALWNDFTFFLRDPVHGDEIEQDDSRTAAGGQVAWHFHRRWRSLSFRTTVGVSARWDGPHVERWHAQARQRLDQFDRDNLSIVDLGGFLEEEVVFNKWVRALAGLRAEYFGFTLNEGVRQFGVFAPKATLVISPLPDKLDLFVNYGTGFHSNQARVALLDGQMQTNAAGESYTVHAIPRLYGGEVGARVHLWNRFDASAAFWISYLENEAVFNADAASFDPSAPTRRLGLDVTLRGRLVSWLWADFDLSYANATAVPSGGNGGAIALAPILYLTGGLTLNTRSKNARSRCAAVCASATWPTALPSTKRAPSTRCTSTPTRRA